MNVRWFLITLYRLLLYDINICIYFQNVGMIKGLNNRPFTNYTGNFGANGYILTSLKYDYSNAYHFPTIRKILLDIF